MHRNLITTLLTLAIAAAAVHAQPAVDKSRVSGIEYHVSNVGVFGQNRNPAAEAGFTYPRDGGRSYIFGSGVWFGAQKRVSDSLRKLVFMTYNPSSAASWASPGEYTRSDSTVVDGHIYYAGDYNTATGQYNGSATPEPPSWPLWLVPGTTVSTRYPGSYVTDPTQRVIGGNYSQPAFMPNVDEQFVTRFHDGALAQYEGFRDAFGFPLGLQFQQAVYSWAPEAFYGSAVVLQYEIVNVSSDTLFDCVVGQVTDADLGYPGNDRTRPFIGIDGVTRASIVTTESTDGDAGFGALATVILESPSTGPTVGSHAGYIDNSRRAELARAHDIYNYVDWAMSGEPATLDERYDMLSREGRDSDTAPSDKRTIIAGRPFSMLPGDTAHFAIAFAVVDSNLGRAHNPGRLDRVSPDGVAEIGMNALVDAIVADYADGTFRTGSASAVESEDLFVGAGIALGPNPAESSTALSLTTTRPADVDMTIVNTMGERVMSMSLGRLDAGAHHMTLDVSRLAPGSYLVVVEAGTERRALKLSVIR